MLETILAYWNDNVLMSVIVLAIISVTLSSLLSRIIRAVTKRRPASSNTPVYRKHAGNTSDAEHLRSFYILKEPEQEPIPVQADSVVAGQNDNSNSLSIGYVRDNEWVTVRHNAYEIVIGSGDNCQVRLPKETGILTEHALILRENKGFCLFAKGKLTLDGKRVKDSVYIQRNAKICIGRHELEVYIES